MNSEEVAEIEKVENDNEPQQDIQEVLQMRFTSQDLPAEVERWLNLIKKYEEQSLETASDNIRAGILQSNIENEAVKQYEQDLEADQEIADDIVAQLRILSDGYTQL